MRPKTIEDIPARDCVWCRKPLIPTPYPADWKVGILYVRHDCPDPEHQGR